MWCPLISMVCCLPAVTPCRVQMHSHEYTLSVSLFFLLLVLPCHLCPYHSRIFLISGPAGRRGTRDGKGGCCQDAGATSPQWLSCCAHPRPGETAGHRLISVITLDMPLCVSDGQTAMVIAYPHTVYTVTDRFLISNQDSGQIRIRDENPYLFVHKVIDIKGWWLVLSTRIAYYGHRAEVISCLCPNIPVLMYKKHSETFLWSRSCFYLNINLFVNFEKRRVLRGFFPPSPKIIQICA